MKYNIRLANNSWKQLQMTGEVSAVPSAPLNVTAYPGNSQATVRWDEPSTAGQSVITGYVVTATPGGQSVTVDATVTAVAVTGLVNGDSYTFRVVAINSYGSSNESSPSNSISPSGAVPSRGPNGLHWPSHTPAYTTPATKSATVATLQSVLNTAVSGDVIEVAPGTVSLTLTGGSSGWTENVLIRPPLGQRQSVTGSVNISGPRITVAGFALGGCTVQAGAHRSGFARIVLSKESQVTITDADDAFLYEAVATEYGSSADRMQARGYVADCNRPSVVGCWLAGKWRAVGASDHNDTIQFWASGGWAVNDPLIEDCVVLTSGDKSVQTGGGMVRRMVWRNTWMNEPNARSEDPPSGYEYYGFHACNGGGYNPRAFGCTVVGSVGNSSVPWDEVRDTTYQSWGPISVAAGNTANPSYSDAPPALADLDTIWGS